MVFGGDRAPILSQVMSFLPNPTSTLVRLSETAKFALPVRRCIETIKLPRRSYTRGIASLLPFFKSLKGLKQLIVPHRLPDNLMEELLEALASSGVGNSIESIDFSYLKLSASFYKVFSDLVRSGNFGNSLMHLRLNGDRFDDPVSFGLFMSAFSGTSSQKLKSLHLEKNDMNIGRSKMLGKMLANGGCPQLEALHLSGNMIGAEGLRELLRSELYKASCNKAMRELHLNTNMIRFEGIKALASFLRDGGFPNLEHLHLLSNDVPSAGMVRLLEALTVAPCRNSLQQLQVGGNQFEGAAAIYLAKSLRFFPNLEALGLSLTGMKPEGGMHLATSFRNGTGRKIRRLGLGSLRATARQVLPAILEGFLPNLEWLNCSYCDLSYEDAIILISAIKQGRLQNLEALQLMANRIGSEGISSLLETLLGPERCCPKLMRLDLESNWCNEESKRRLKTVAKNLTLFRSGLELKW